MSMDMDIESFLKGLDMSNQAVLRGAKRGVGKAAMALLNDAVMETPMVPLDEGTLRGSGSAFVNGALVQTAQAQGGNPTPATSAPKPLNPNVIEGLAGFNTEYAAYLHEGVSHTGKPLEYGHTREKRGRPPVTGTGAKYLEKPMSKHRKDYMRVVAVEVKKELRGA